MAGTGEQVAELRSIGDELLDLSRIARLQGWDQETMMPPAGTIYRARQQATLQGLAHERLTRPHVGDLLAALAEPALAGDLTPVDAAAVRELQREYDRATKLPNEFVKELAQTTAEGVEIWRRARHESRFSDFAPALERIIDGPAAPGVGAPGSVRGGA
jgi:carboxypeptidase Taq